MPTIATSYIARHLEPLVSQLTQEYPALLVTGARQVGKTTMLKHLAKGSARTYVSLDDLELRKAASEDPRWFLERYKPPVLIDEIQYAPALLTYIKISVDEREQPGDYWLTGSQLFKLMDGVQESLVGRAALLSMRPLTYAEISGYPNSPFVPSYDALLALQQQRAALDAGKVFEAMLQGGMPALVSKKRSNTQVFYESYLGTYLERDLISLSPRIDSFRFLDFIKSAALRVGKTVNYASMAQDAAVNEKTAKAWLKMLEALGVVMLLHPYSDNALKRTVKSPKLYFYDTGLATYLAGFRDATRLSEDSLSGAFFENYVVTQIATSYTNSGTTPALYYYGDNRKTEIDLVLEHDRKLYPIEIKQSTNPSIHVLRSFNALDATGRRAAGSVVCNGPALSEYNLDNLMVPVGLV